MKNVSLSNIEIIEGDLFDAPVDALVNTVNCVGVMGKGIARQFANKFPENTTEYKKACQAGRLLPGRVQVVDLTRTLSDGPRYVINFATKDHWRGKSRLSWIKTGLAYLIAEIRARNITSVAVPPLGCGNGGLEWEEVLPLIEAAFAEIPDVQALIFAPAGAPVPEKMVPGEPPKMTLANALYLHLLHIYTEWELVFSQIEIQKLAYFLQEAGEPLRLNFVRGKYGPFAPNMRQVIGRWEGHWMRGFGDGTGVPHSPMTLNTNAVEDAEYYLRTHAEQDTWDRMSRVTRLIKGFESAWGIELLATTHWVVHRENIRTCEEAINAVREWSKYKANTFDTNHVRIAWQRLQEEGWLLNKQ